LTTPPSPDQKQEAPKEQAVPTAPASTDQKEQPAPVSAAAATPAPSAAGTGPLTSLPAISPALQAQIDAAEQEWLLGWRTGPTRLRWAEPPVQPGDAAPDLELVDTTGKKVHLKDYWEKKPLLILFWRHFGCSCGVDRAARLKREYKDYLSAGGNVIVVTQGEPERAAEYARQHEIPCPVLCDPEFKSYEAYGLLEGTPAQILFDAEDALLARDWNAGQKLSEDRKAKGRPMVDSPWQLPGEFIVGKDGKVILAYRYNFCEDWPDARVLTSAIRLANNTVMA
jgi:peroxiredoxin